MRVLVVTVLLASCSPSPTPKTAPTEKPAEHPKPLVHRFEKAEDWAKEFDDPSRDAWQKPDLVIAAMKIAEGSTVVDLGTGTGYFLGRLSRAVGGKGKVIALDVEPDMIRYVKERAQKESLANVEARVVATDDPGLAEASVDRVLVVDTWHHIPGRKEYAAKIARALRPGGALCIVDFTKEAPHGPPKHHRLAPEDAIGELGAAGLSAERVPAALPEQWIVVGRRPG
ncbi:MAG: class I SAM-dependent methyltransferase [Polyangiales bacterium]